MDDTKKLELFDKFLEILGDYETPAHSRIAQMQILCNQAGINYNK